jgi:hypothetical protein
MYYEEKINGLLIQLTFHLRKNIKPIRTLSLEENNQNLEFHNLHSCLRMHQLIGWKSTQGEHIVKKWDKAR